MNRVEMKDMKLHEIRSFDTFSVLRVSNGWIYTIWRLDCGQMNSVFVPLFHN